MDGQMDIFDFIERPEELTQSTAPAQPETMFEQLFAKIKNPVMRCANCLCHYCTHNVEELYDTVKPQEVAEPPCFVCDECRTYSGDCMDREQAREECNSFVMSDYGANRNRKRFQIIQGGEHGQS